MSTQVISATDLNNDEDGEASPQNPCPICRTAECDAALACGHQYCFACLNEWYRRQPTTATVRCLQCNASASTGPAIDWRNALLQLVRCVVALAIIVVDWYPRSHPWFELARLLDRWCLLFSVTNTVLALIQFWLLMNHTTGSVAGYLLRIAANMFKFGPSLLGQLQDCDTVLETMQLHYRTGCSVWSDSCYVPIINISYGNDTKVFHFPFTTNFFSIVMSIGVVASLCLLLLLLSAVRLRKQFIYSKLSSPADQQS